MILGLMTLGVSLQIWTSAVDCYVAHLMIELKGERSKERLHAVDQLADLGALAKKAVPSLLMTLDDPTAAGADRACLALEMIGADAVPELSKALDSKNDVRKSKILTILGNIGSDARAAAPMIRKALESEDVITRLDAAKCMSRIDPTDKDATRVLVQMLKQKERTRRFRAACALSRMKHDGEQAIPVLLEAIQTEYENNIDREYQLHEGWIALYRVAGNASKFAKDLESIYSSYGDKEEQGGILLVSSCAISKIDGANKQAMDRVKAGYAELAKYARSNDESWARFGFEVLQSMDLKNPEAAAVARDLIHDTLQSRHSLVRTLSRSLQRKLSGND